MTPAQRPSGPVRPAASGRGWLLLAACAYLMFVVYGSLVPLQYRSLSWQEAIDGFKAIPYLALGISSRADWVANLLLFIPLAFLWTGAAWPRRGVAARTAVVLAVFTAGVALSLGIEFVQLFFPQRTVSINDIVAESIGAALGILLWCLAGAGTLRWLQSLRLVQGQASTAQRLLLLYLAVLFGYSLLPLDLTISPVEVYNKWRDGKVFWLPFSALQGDLAQQVYDLATDIAIWVPAAALWRLAFGASRWSAFGLAVAAATVLEILQLFVYSRVSDSTDIFTAAVGAAIGVSLVRSSRASPSGTRPAAALAAFAWALAAATWAGVLAAVFWYPFDFHVDRAFLHDRLAGLRRVPFEAYYFGSEFRAITEVLRKTLFFVPLGWLLGRCGRSLPGTWPRPAIHGVALLLIAGTAAAIEGGQLLLPTKNADLTDGALEFLGGVLGYFGGLALNARMAGPPGSGGRHRVAPPR